MDVLLSAGQCPVCLSYSLETQGKLHLASGICLELFLTSLVWLKYRPKLKMPCKRFFLSVVSWSCHSKDDCCRLARICLLKKICTFIDTRSPKAKASPQHLAGLSSGTASAFTEPGDVCRPITSKTRVKVYHGHGGNANVLNNTSLYMYLSFMIRYTCVGLSYV